MTTKQLLDQFLIQAQAGDLKTSPYPKDWNGLAMKVSFGMGSPARVPWIAFVAPEIIVSNGYYPVYLFYKDLNCLVLSYGISETNEHSDTWPTDITDPLETIGGYLGNEAPRYGGSYVFKAYDISFNDGLNYKNHSSKEPVTETELEANLEQILKQYQEIMALEAYNPDSKVSQGIFYLEKQLEDFIIHNWNNTGLSEKYELILEEGVLLSQQYRTGIGPIDILVKDKKSGSYVIIELKKNQTSDDTIGQVARYMGWIEEKFNDKGVKGIIIAKEYDKKLEYALKRVSGIEVYVYEVDFRLKEFK